jgi:HD domain/Cytidylyltransferase-like
MATIVVYGGGFQPFHVGHLSSYLQAKKAFPDAAFYVAASNDTKQRPIPFKDKQFLAQQAGVKDPFVETRNPINPVEILSQYNPETDVYVIVRSERDPMPYTKKDGSPAYYQPYVKGEPMQPFGKHGYVFVTKKHTFMVGGQEIYSGTQVRDMYTNADDKGRLELIHELYPNSKQQQTIKQMLDKYLAATAPTADIKTNAMSKLKQKKLAEQINKLRPLIKEGTVEQKKKFMSLVQQALNESRIMDRNAKINAYYISKAGNRHKVAENIPYYLLDKLVPLLTKKYAITMNDIMVVPVDHTQYRRTSQPEMADEGIMDFMKKKPAVAKKPMSHAEIRRLAQEPGTAQQKVFRSPEEFAKAKQPAMAEDKDDYTDPQTRQLLAKAKQHYPGSKNKQQAFMRFVQRSLGHAEQDDRKQDAQIQRLEQELALIKQSLQQPQGVDEGMFDVFKKKQPKIEVPDPGNYPRIGSDIAQWMRDAVEYHKATLPDSLWKLFCPSYPDYLPTRVRVGTSEKTIRAHLGDYVQLRDANPEAKKLARQKFEPNHIYPNGPREDYQNKGVDEAYDHNAPFNAADFNRHMEQLRAREELRKTDPVKALVGDLIDKDNAARNVKKKPQDDSSMDINDPRHPGWGALHNPLGEDDRDGMKDGRPYSDPLRRHPGNESYMTPDYLIQKYQERLSQIAAGPYKRPKEVAQLKSRIAKLQGQHNVDEGSEEALQYATKAHAGQTRSGGDPYITHPMRVADHIRKYKQSHNLDALISAAYLHDTIEDTDTTQEVLHDLFGGLVASLVQELTSDPEQIKKMGKAQYLSHKMAAMSSYGLVIKLADRLDNVKDITTARTPQWRAKYAKETNQILDYIEKTRALSGTHNKLISLIRAKLAEIDQPQQGISEADDHTDLLALADRHEKTGKWEWSQGNYEGAKQHYAKANELRDRAKNSQDVTEAPRKPRKPAAPQFTKYTNYELWERERYARGANYSETEIDGRLVGVAVVGTTYNEWGYVRDTGKVVGMWYNKAGIGSFVQDGTSFDDSLSYAEQDTAWPYMNESQGVAEAEGITRRGILKGIAGAGALGAAGKASAIAGAFPTPSHQAAMYKAAADSNAAQARADAAEKAKRDAQRLKQGTSDIERLNKINYHGGKVTPTNAEWDGDGDFMYLDGTQYSMASRMPIKGDEPRDMKLISTREGRQVYIWTRYRMKGDGGHYFYPAPAGSAQINEFAPGNGDDDGLPQAEYEVYQCSLDDQFEWIGEPLMQTDRLDKAHGFAYKLWQKHPDKCFMIWQERSQGSRGGYGPVGSVLAPSEDDVAESSDYLDEK